ncbi:MAG: hypothetical protein NTZ73_03610 [Candidatus Diapherotrites archaeon]|nr:hypothetical protein [Candidatus Diapherotrites archaeon]
MEFEFRENEIVFERALSDLDKLVIRFVRILDETKVDYVIISGYIAILFGRSRNTEDVDLFIEEMPLGKFEKLWAALKKAGFECIHFSSAKDAYEDYLKSRLAVRFAEKGRFIPNFELKYPESDLNKYSLKNKVSVRLNGEALNTSRLELQIPYKLYLGSDKDFEDAAHLWQVFKEHLDKELFEGFVKRLNVEDKVRVLE